MKPTLRKSHLLTVISTKSTKQMCFERFDGPGFTRLCQFLTPIRSGGIMNGNSRQNTHIYSKKPLCPHMCTERTSNYIIIGYIVHLCFAPYTSRIQLFQEIVFLITLLINRNFACSTLITVKDGQTDRHTHRPSIMLLCAEGLITRIGYAHCLGRTVHLCCDTSLYACVCVLQLLFCSSLNASNIGFGTPERETVEKQEGRSKE